LNTPELLGYACSFVRSFFTTYVLNGKLQYQSAEAAQADWVSGNAVLILRVATKVGFKTVKVIKTLIVLRQVVMNVELMEFPFPSSGIVASFIT
jgi:hypothetical protein